MKPAHSMLEPLEELGRLLDKKVATISLRTPDRSKWYRWLPFSALRHLSYQFLMHVDMALNILRAGHVDAFLVYEFNLPYVLPVVVALLLRNKTSFIILHGAQQLASRSVFHRAGFELLRLLIQWSKAYGVHLERGDGCLPPKLRLPRSKTIEIPLPHPRAENASTAVEVKRERDVIKVGIVGMLRTGKDTETLIRRLLEARQQLGDDVEIVVGTPHWQKAAWMDDLDVNVHDTSSQDQYEKLLQQLHVVVCDFNRENYFFRPSGVIGDALMNGCRVVCPNFPVFRKQVLNPVRVGRLFSNQGDMIRAVGLACADCRAEEGAEQFKAWRKERRVSLIVERIRGKVNL